MSTEITHFEAQLLLHESEHFVKTCLDDGRLTRRGNGVCKRSAENLLFNIEHPELIYEVWYKSAHREDQFRYALVSREDEAEIFAEALNKSWRNPFATFEVRKDGVTIHRYEAEPSGHDNIKLYHRDKAYLEREATKTEKFWSRIKKEDNE